MLIRSDPSASSSGTWRELAFTWCLRDDDARVFEFRTTSDDASVMNLVTSAVSRGRKVRAYLLAVDPCGRTREQRFLVGRGYVAMPVAL